MPAHPTRAFAACALGALIAIAAAGCAADGEPPAQEPAPIVDTAPLPSEEELSAAVADALGDAAVPGGAVMLTAADGDRVVDVFGSATTDTEVTEATRFAYRSITKTFIGTVVLQLADEGALHVDDPISQFVDGVPNGDDITIEHLAAMRSGLANYLAMPETDELFEADPEHSPDDAELLEIAYSASPVFAPGEAYQYSNTNTLLLGAVIAEVTGEPWERAIAERITEPLQLASVHVGADGSGFDADGFDVLGAETLGRVVDAAPGWYSAAGGLDGDVVDLAAWGRALGSGSLLDLGTHDYRSATLGGVEDDPSSPEYDRYGFALGEIDGWVGHTGNGLGFESLVLYDPGTGRTVAILLNGASEDANLPAHMFRAMLPVLSGA